MTTTMRVLKADQVTSRQEETSVQAALEQIRKDERDAELAAARAEGVVQGLAMARQEGAAAAPRIGAALEELVRLAHEEHRAAVEETSRAMLAGAVDIAEWVLRHELSQSGTSVIARLGQAVNALLPAPSTRVRVSPADAEQVHPWARAHGVEVEVDPTVAMGDAYLDNGVGAVDVSVAAALRIVAHTLGIDPAAWPQ